MFFSPISHSVSAIFKIADSTPLVFLFSQFLQMTYKPYVSTLVMHYGLIYKNSFVWAAPCKNMSSGICGQERPKVILRIRTVWSRSSLSAKKKKKKKKKKKIIWYYIMYEMGVKTRMTLCSCTCMIEVCAFCACLKVLFLLDATYIQSNCHVVVVFELLNCYMQKKTTKM